MGQFFTDDVDDLIKLGHGDQERLARIKEEYMIKKLVTLEDRRYVEGLISRYIRPAPEIQQEKPKPREERIVPPPPPKPQTRVEPKVQTVKVEKKLSRVQQKRIRPMTIGVASVAIAVLIVSVVAINQDQFPSFGRTPAAENLELDQQSYFRGDIISISGKTATAATTVDLAIFNAANQQIWTETLSVRQDGTYSTLVIAGGTGWEQQGTYTATATYGGMQDTATFTFSPVSQG